MIDFFFENCHITHKKLKLRNSNAGRVVCYLVATDQYEHRARQCGVKWLKPETQGECLQSWDLIQVADQVVEVSGQQETERCWWWLIK